MNAATMNQPMFLQGDLQTVFDALYDMGIIEPVLEKDWKKSLLEIEKGSQKLMQAIAVVKRCGRDRTRLKAELSMLDRQALEHLAMEVAREYAGYHTRDEQSSSLQ